MPAPPLTSCGLVLAEKSKTSLAAAPAVYVDAAAAMLTFTVPCAEKGPSLTVKVKLSAPE